MRNKHKSRRFYGKINLLIFIALSAYFLSACNSGKQKPPYGVESITTKYIPVTQLIAYQDTAMLNEIAPYKAHLDSMMNVEIGFSPMEYFKKKPNGLLNNIAADMVLTMTRKSLEGQDYSPDFCLLNYGGLRHPLPKGVITISDVYQLMPFQNEVVILKLSGDKVEELFNYIATTGGQPVAGCVINISNGKFLSATINGKPFDKNKTYFLVTSDYLAKGGDRMSFLKNPLSVYKTGMLLRNAMLSYIKSETAAGREIIASQEERIKIR